MRRSCETVSNEDFLDCELLDIPELVYLMLARIGVFLKALGRMADHTQSPEVATSCLVLSADLLIEADAFALYP